jgi:HAD superfamily phosphatase (TIGR01668 family)
MSWFTPDLILHRITDIDMDLLNQHGIRGIILDVDNTLTFHGSQEVDPSVLEWLDQMKQQNIDLVIASNNYEERVRPFAQRLGLDYLSMSCKPMTFSFTKACKRFHLKPSQMAIVGDQIYTDIVGGKIKGLFTILVEPFEYETGWFFKFKRRMERIHIRHYERLHKLTQKGNK